jgi:GPH family glycoside/pentoside/hexuronide:cation symporter
MLKVAMKQSIYPAAAAPACPPRLMMAYSLGECANSLVMNGIFGFAMLFYTKSLGLDPVWAGLAMSLSVFWEAMSEPIMGYISDNTRSRWGRRLPYMLVGGLLMAVCSYLIWVVPAPLRGSQMSMFWYLVGINLLLRTGLTMFFIPYLALGFEICTNYQDRSRLQGIRQIFNMIANFAGPAMAWLFFFADDGAVQATTVEANYRHMGAAFAIATMVMVMLVVALTYHRRADSRGQPSRPSGGWFMQFVRETTSIVLDVNARWVFVFIFIVCSGMVIVSSLQMFVYDDFMKFSALRKSIAHGSTMVGMAIGAALSITMASRLDKKETVIIGGLISIACSLMLALLFLTDLVARDATVLVGEITVPIALILFVIGHAGYWLGNGIMLPTATAMMADVGEMRSRHTRENKDGGYASVFSLAMRMAISFSLIVAGWSLSAIGYLVPKDGHPITQSSAAIWRLGMVTFVIGAAICGIALLAIRNYPLQRAALEHEPHPELLPL